MCLELLGLTQNLLVGTTVFFALKLSLWNWVSLYYTFIEWVFLVVGAM